MIGLLAALSAVRASSSVPGGLAQQATILTSVSIATSDPSSPSVDSDARPPGDSTTTTAPDRTEGTRIPAPDVAQRPTWLDAGPSPVVSIFEPGSTRQAASGILVDGVVLTSAQALRGRTAIEIELGADQRTAAEVRGIDPFSDLAVLVASDGSSLGSPDDGTETTATSIARAGLANEAVPPGSPPTSGSTSTAGPTPGTPVWLVVADGVRPPSAFPGTIVALAQDIATSDGHPVFDAMATSIVMPTIGAGGALLDEQGTILGMVVACDEYFANAVPISVLRATAASILETGWAHAGWLGLTGEGSDDGVTIIDVEADGPAENSGIIAGDVVVRIGGEPVEQMSELIRAIRRAGPGATLSFTIERDDELVTVDVVIGSRT